MIANTDVSGVLAWKSAAKSNEKLVDPKYATLLIIILDAL